MTVRTIVERFVLDHLEEHADQLDGLELVSIDEIRRPQRESGEWRSTPRSCAGTTAPG